MSILDEKSMQVNLKHQDVSVGSEIYFKFSSIHDIKAIKKARHTVAAEHNLEMIQKAASQRVNQQVLLLYLDEDQQLLQFTTDDQILTYLSRKNKIFYRSRSEAVKNNQRLISEPFRVPAFIKTSKRVEQKILNQSILQEKQQKIEYSQPKLPQKAQIKIEEQQKQKPKAQQKPQNAINKQLVQKMQKEIVSILAKNHSHIAQHIIPHDYINRKAKFNLICTFCKKDDLKDRISTCELNMKVIACQQCSKYLAYQCPLPFKPYTSSEEFQKDKTKQSKQAEKEFIDRLQFQKAERNKRMMEQMSSLSLLQE